MGTPVDQVAPADAPGRARRMAAPLGAAAVTGLALAAAAWWDPGDGGPGLCPFRTITGLDCPFCGSTRSAAALANADLLAALDHNAFFVLLLVPLAAVAWVTWAVRAWRGQPFPVLSNRLVVALLGVGLVWWAVRLVVPWLGSAASV